MNTVLIVGLATLGVVVSLVLGLVALRHQRVPMAIVILGGLVTSTVLNLFVVPSLYVRFGKKKEAKRKVLLANGNGVTVMDGTAQSMQMTADNGTVVASKATSLLPQESTEQESHKQDEQSFLTDGKPP